jgi:hypothetical protein
MRALHPDLEAALSAGVRRPAYRVYAFDTKLDEVSAIIAGTYTQTPKDLTEYIVGPIAWTPAQMAFSLADSAGDFHPDTGAEAHYLADGCLIRLKEGDSRVAEANWIWTFTGFLKGQVGWIHSRTTQTFKAQVAAFSRDNNQAFKRRKCTSKNYTAGTDLGILVEDVAGVFLGLEDWEYLIPKVLGRALMHKENQMVQMAPWDMVSACLEVVSAVPVFNGEGKLTLWSKNLSRPPDRLLPDYIRVFDYQIPAVTQDGINKVIVTYLDSELTEIEGDFQVLGQASITTGFFTFEEKLPCYWSKDRRQRAKRTEMHVIKSVNDNLLPVGEESYQQNDAFHGTITIEISVWVPILAGALLAGYLASAWIPDSVVMWETIPVGRALEAANLIGILLIMMSLGSAQYEIWGVPYDFVYLEKQSIAIEDGLEYWQENELEIRNDFIGSQDQADSVALTELIYQKSSLNARKLSLDDDLALETGDIVQLPDGRRMFITNLSKQIERGQVPRLNLDGFKVLQGALV